MSLIKQLVKEGYLDKEKAASLEFEIKEYGKKEEDVILERGIIAEDALFDLKSKTLKIPLKEVSPDQVPLELLELMPEETAKNYEMIPIAREDKVLDVGMIYPENLKSQEALKFLSRQGGFNYKVFLITPTTFNNLLKQYRTLRKEVGMALEELETELKEDKVKIEPRVGKTDFEKLAEEAPITKIVAVILRHAVEGNASDVHIEPTRDKLRVRFRLLGTLHSSIFLPLKVHPAVVARIKIISNLKIDETRVPQDGRFSTKVDDKSVDFRVSTFPTTLGEKIALRVLDPDMGLKSFGDLGLEDRDFKTLESAITKPYGLILVTGPTGCGKSTTLYSALQLLNKEGVNIITLEDPVEYFVGGLNQSQIRPEIGYEFSTGLRHILRQDPDIIMVGEIRDEETANLVTHAALTGHIVLSTLHTANATGAIPRLVDMGIKPYLIPPTLQLVIAQRLVRRLCDKCKKKVTPKIDIKNLILGKLEELPINIKKTIKIPKPFVIWEPVGCKDCNKTGFSGRIAVFEMLLMTDSLSEIILKEPSEQQVAKEVEKQGMITMQQDGLIKVVKGKTTIEEVLKVAEEV